MPWFPVPFKLIEPPNTKTDDYEYHEVSWTNNIYSPAIKRLVIAQDSSYWYYYGYGFGDEEDAFMEDVFIITDRTSIKDLSTVHPTKKTITNIPATLIRASMVPSEDKAAYRMRYVLKFKAKPSSKNKVVKFLSCNQQKMVTEVTRKDLSDGTEFQWFYYAGSDIPIAHTTMSVQQGENAVITRDYIAGADFENLYFTGIGGNWNDNNYDALMTKTYYETYTVDLSKPGSYGYLIFDIMHYDVTGIVNNRYFSNGEQADCSCFLSMELDKEDDIIFGEGFSMIYLGETLVDAGMINMGENAPSAIYIGENLVWNS